MGPKFEATLRIPKILAHIAFSIATWFVMSQQSFKSSSQVSIAQCSHLLRPASCTPSWIQSRQYSFLQHIHYVVTILCVVHGIVMLRHRQLCRDSVFVQLLQIGVATQFLCRDNISIWFLLQRCFLYCQHFYRD